MHAHSYQHTEPYTRLLSRGRYFRLNISLGALHPHTRARRVPDERHTRWGDRCGALRVWQVAHSRAKSSTTFDADGFYDESRSAFFLPPRLRALLLHATEAFRSSQFWFLSLWGRRGFSVFSRTRGGEKLIDGKVRQGFVRRSLGIVN